MPPYFPLSPRFQPLSVVDCHSLANSGLMSTGFARLQREAIQFPGDAFSGDSRLVSRTSMMEW